MELSIRLQSASCRDLAAIHRLYCAAFPINERKPFSLVLRQRRRGISEILSLYSGDLFLGFAVVVRYKDMALVDFFAISPEARCGGVGSRALQLLRERYRDERLFLEIERVMPDADNNEQRLRRKNFYLRNGMVESGVLLRVYNCDIELIHAKAPVSFREYCDLLLATAGKSYYRILHPASVDQ